MDDDPRLARELFLNPTELLRTFDASAVWAQNVIKSKLKDQENASIKKFVHVRINISGSPLECAEASPRTGRVRVKHRGILLTLKGTVIRSGTVNMIEGEKEFLCRKCKSRFKVYRELESINSQPEPSSCPSQGIVGKWETTIPSS